MLPRSLRSLWQGQTVSNMQVKPAFTKHALVEARVPSRLNETSSTTLSKHWECFRTIISMPIGQLSIRFDFQLWHLIRPPMNYADSLYLFLLGVRIREVVVQRLPKWSWHGSQSSLNYICTQLWQTAWKQNAKRMELGCQVKPHEAIKICKRLSNLRDTSMRWACTHGEDVAGSGTLGMEANRVKQRSKYMVWKM